MDGLRPSDQKSFARGVLPDLAAFCIGLGIAWFFKWETRDLVWSLWLCSLVIGYISLLVLIGAGACQWFSMANKQPLGTEVRNVHWIVPLLVGLFFLAFFSLHFCGFHAGHSVFLHLFFPLEGLPDDGFGKAFMNPVLLWIYVFKHLIVPYGIFLIPALIAERKYVFRPFSGNPLSVPGSEVSPDSIKSIKRVKAVNPIQEGMARPYKNIVRMHILIFFFAFSHFLKIDSFIVYTVVYSVYFFPWTEFKKLKIRPTAA